MTRSIIKTARWVLGVDRRESASPPIRVIRCTLCNGRSEPDTAQLGPDSWALKHAGATRHTGFVEIVTAHLRATLLDSNPAGEERP